MEKPKFYHAAAFYRGGQTKVSQIFVIPVYDPVDPKSRKVLDDIFKPHLYEVEVNGRKYLIGRNILPEEEFQKTWKKLCRYFTPVQNVKGETHRENLEELIHVLAAAGRVCSELR